MAWDWISTPNHLANTENSKINMCYISFHMLLSARGLPLTVQQKVVKRNRALQSVISHQGGRCQGFQFPSGAAGGLIIP